MLSRLGVDENDPELDVRTVLDVSLEQVQREDSNVAQRFRLLAVFPSSFLRNAAAAVWHLVH
jgi:hypothetical protein